MTILAALSCCSLIFSASEVSDRNLFSVNSSNTGIAKMMLPVGTINVCNPEQAAQVKAIQQGLEWADEHKNWRSLRPLYHERYKGQPASNAVECSACWFRSLRGY